MTEKRDKYCNLEVTRNGRNECWSLCSKYHDGFKCCKVCEERDSCNKLCGYLRRMKEK